MVPVTQAEVGPTEVAPVAALKEEKAATPTNHHTTLEAHLPEEEEALEEVPLEALHLEVQCPRLVELMAVALPLEVLSEVVNKGRVLEAPQHTEEVMVVVDRATEWPKELRRQGLVEAAAAEEG